MRVFNLALVALLSFWAAAPQAALTIDGADGTDGALHVTEDTVIDLSEAVNVGETPITGKGVYDKDQWAVVFKYSSVTVDAGATLSFKNHPSRAPVVWLVSGDVTIEGTVSVDGAEGAVAPGLAEPGPGGFRGGMGYYSPGVDAASGFGIGGGSFQDTFGYSGSYGSLGYLGSQTYGNPSLVPLIGGSGGGGDGDDTAGGGAGGGALLIACGGTLTVNGAINANGGNISDANAGGGSGGGIRLIADTLAGSGVLTAVGGVGWGGGGGIGRIRVEYVEDTSALQVTPSPSVVDLAPDSTAPIWPPNDAPQVKIISIGGESVSDDPRASFGTYGADAVIAETTTTQVVVETTNVEAASEVKVRVTPRTNVAYTEVTAGVPSEVSAGVLHWTADIPVQVGYSAVQVQVIRP